MKLFCTILNLVYNHCKYRYSIEILLSILYCMGNNTLSICNVTPPICCALPSLRSEESGALDSIFEWQLLVKDLVREDAGEYSCTATNAHGHDSMTTSLLVLGKLTDFARGLNVVKRMFLKPFKFFSFLLFEMD